MLFLSFLIACVVTGDGNGLFECWALLGPTLVFCVERQAQTLPTEVDPTGFISGSFLGHLVWTLWQGFCPCVAAALYWRYLLMAGQDHLFLPGVWKLLKVLMIICLGPSLHYDLVVSCTLFLWSVF